MLKPQPLSVTAWKTVCFYQRVCNTSAWDLSMAETKCRDANSQRIAVSMKASAVFLREDQTSRFEEKLLSMNNKKFSRSESK